MKFPPFPLVVLGLQVDRALAAFRPDIKGPVEVAELEPDQVVTDDATEVEMRLPPGSDFVVLFKCSEDNKEIAVSDDNQFVGCCLPGQHLSGSEQTSFDCCGQNHDLAGDAQVGYVCCPTGYVYDGSKCKEGSGSNDVGGTRQPVQQQQQMVSKGGSRAIGKSKASDGNGSGADSNGGGSDSNDRGGDNVGGSSDGQDGVDDRSDQGQAQNHHNHPQMVQQQQHNAKDDGNPYGNERNNNMQQPQSRYQGAGSYQADGSFQAGGSYQGGGRGNGNGGSKALCGIGTTLVNGQCVCTSGECGPGPVTIITCANGTQPVNGKCVCPKGYTWGSDGWCRPCTFGLETGKCYTFAYPNRSNSHLIGYTTIGDYYGPAPEDRNHRAGKFKLCEDQACTPGIPIDPADGFRILDTNGDPNTGANPNQWLDNKQNGGHMGKTPNYADAGIFTLTKWPCGKYCLGGLNAGIGPTCPSDVTGMTFTTADKDSCVVVDLMEVPCDIHAKENNCIWKNGDECCNKVDCAGKR